MTLLTSKQKAFIIGWQLQIKKRSNTSELSSQKSQQKKIKNLKKNNNSTESCNTQHKKPTTKLRCDRNRPALLETAATQQQPGRRPAVNLTAHTPRRPPVSKPNEIRYSNKACCKRCNHAASPTAQTQRRSLPYGG